MRLADIHPGVHYKLKEYDYTPNGWNPRGDMNHYMGQIVKVTSTAKGFITIEQTPDDKHIWFFHSENFEHKQAHVQLEDDLFEI